MSTTDVEMLGESTPITKTVDLKLEAVVIPVSNVERSKAFYANLGWRLDADFSFDNGFRVVQFTPPGSGTSIQFGANISTAPPGSAQGLYLVVSDIESAREELAARGAQISEVFHPSTPGGQFEPASRDTSHRGEGGAPRELRIVRDPPRPRRQHLATPRDHDAAARPHRRQRDVVRVDRRPRRRDATRIGRPRRARGSDRQGRRELARLVRGLHGR